MCTLLGRLREVLRQPLTFYLMYMRFLISAVAIGCVVYSLPWISEILGPTLAGFFAYPSLATAILLYSLLVLLVPVYCMDAARVSLRRAIKGPIK